MFCAIRPLNCNSAPDTHCVPFDLVEPPSACYSYTSAQMTTIILLQVHCAAIEEDSCPDASETPTF